MTAGKRQGVTRQQFMAFAGGMSADMLSGLASDGTVSGFARSTDWVDPKVAQIVSGSHSLLVGCGGSDYVVFTERASHDLKADGMPSLAMPAQTAAAGWPVRLNG